MSVISSDNRKEAHVRNSGSPFVNFRMKPTKEIGSTPTLIFGSQFGCMIDGLIVANQVDTQILFSLYLLREEGTPTPTEAVEYPFVLNKPLTAKESIDWLEAKALFLQPGDTLYAYSDYNENLFNTFVSYRELTELVGS